MVEITISFRYQLAKAFLEFFILHLKSYHLDEGIDWVVYCYQNGREHGFEICNFEGTDDGYAKRSVTFSENRNSDHLVVYPNSWASQGIDDWAYGHAKYFEKDQWFAACEYCYEVMVGKILHRPYSSAQADKEATEKEEP